MNADDTGLTRMICLSYLRSVISRPMVFVGGPLLLLSILSLSNPAVDDGQNSVALACISKGQQHSEENEHRACQEDPMEIYTRCIPGIAGCKPTKCGGAVR